MAALDWEGLLEQLAAHLSPDWMEYARSHGDQDWVRLVLMVDAHHQLSSPRAGEKVANTMYHLAADHDRGDEAEGWEAIETRLRDARVELVATVVDSAEGILSEAHYPMFIRSAEPMRAMQ